MSGYCEITCFDCNEHLGWHTDSGPGPMYFCDCCHEKNLEQEEDNE